MTERMESFYYLRHGQTTPNLEGFICGGDWDVPLNENGRTQAKIAAEMIFKAKWQVKSICTSPMKRAQETSQMVAGAIKAPIYPIEGLEERHIGEWEGKVWNELKDDFLGGKTPLGGESMEEFKLRIKKTLEKIWTYETPILIVSHGAVWLEICDILGMEQALIGNGQPIEAIRRLSTEKEKSFWKWKYLSQN